MLLSWQCNSSTSDEKEIALKVAQK